MFFILFLVVALAEPTPFTLYPGEKLELSCKGKEETQEVTWTKDHVPLVDGEHTRLRDHQMEIETVEPADSGLYACFAQGPNSNHTDYFNVNVTGEKWIEYKKSDRLTFVLFTKTTKS